MGVGDRQWETGIKDVGKEMGKKRKGEGIFFRVKQNRSELLRKG